MKKLCHYRTTSLCLHVTAYKVPRWPVSAPMACHMHSA